jgi:hypothetical protein
MLNRITGWLLFGQALYLTAFATLTLVDRAAQRIVSRTIADARYALGIPNTRYELSDYLYYPFVFSAPLNLILALIFFWRLLRAGADFSIRESFFSILNTIYVAASGWILFMAFAQILRHHR